MNVGTLTFQYAFNYGAILQCLALQRALVYLGVETDVINYFPPPDCEIPWWRGWGIRNGRFLETSFRRGVDHIFGPEMRRKFNGFRDEYLSLSTVCSDRDILNIAIGYDALIVGSDQVWNHPKSPTYFLGLGPEYRGKRISYAASFGQAHQLPENERACKKWLKRFDALSVRDELSKELVRRYCGRDADVVADPTLLVDLDDMKKDVPLPYDDYLLVYVLGDDIRGGQSAMLDILRKELGGIPVVAVIPSAHKPHWCPWADRKVWRAGPKEWLSLVSKARFIYTDSFHGAVYAMKYQKPFVAYYSEEARAPRLLDLAKRYGIERQVIASLDEALGNCAWSAMPDYDHIDRLISDHVERSYAFLHRSLGLEGGVSGRSGGSRPMIPEDDDVATR